MTGTAVFLFSVWQEGSTENAIPANENTLHIQAAFGPAKDFSDAKPSSPTAYDQYIVRTTWGGFGVGNIVIYVNGTWLEFATFNGLSKIVNGIRHVRVSGSWLPFIEWVDVPATASSTGKVGQVAQDPTTLLFYVCIATNTWKQCQLTPDVAAPPPAPTYPTPTLLLDYEGSSVADRGPNHLALTVGGSAALSTAHFKFGASALNVNGGYIRVSDSSIITGVQDFTVDMWIYPTSVTGDIFLFDSRDNGNADNGFAFYIHGAGYLGFYDGATYMGSDSSGQSGTALSLNQWQHVEVGRSSGTVYLFINGNVVASSTTNAYPNNFHSSIAIIHAAQYFPAGVSPMPGYADEVRLIVGECAHVANFTAPTAPYPTY
jgi:hypothetical protein